jgi:hypothetical protein
MSDCVSLFIQSLHAAFHDDVRLEIRLNATVRTDTLVSIGGKWRVNSSHPSQYE